MTARKTLDMTLVDQHDTNPYAPKTLGPTDYIDKSGLLVQMDDLERELNRRDPIGDIAAIVRKLTYGEMVEVSTAIWASRSGDIPLTAESLPHTLHRWSTGKG